MFKTLFKVAVVAGAVAGAVHLWRRFEVTERLVAITDELLTKYAVGDQENAPQNIRDEESFIDSLRMQRDAATSGHRS
jgi:hypothetical protein